MVSSDTMTYVVDELDLRNRLQILVEIGSDNVRAMEFKQKVPDTILTRVKQAEHFNQLILNSNCSYTN